MAVAPATPVDHHQIWPLYAFWRSLVPPPPLPCRDPWYPPMVLPLIDHAIDVRFEAHMYSRIMNSDVKAHYHGCSSTEVSSHIAYDLHSGFFFFFFFFFKEIGVF